MQKLSSLALLLLGLASAAQAADTSVTTPLTQRRTLDPMGVAPRLGYIEAVATAGAESAQALTLDSIKPNNGMAILGYTLTTTSSNGSQKLLRVNYASNTGVISVNSNTTPAVGAAGQISSGDVVKLTPVYGY